MSSMEKVDKKFKFNSELGEQTDVYTIPHPSFELRGVKYYEGEGFLRLPIDVAASVSDAVRILAHHTSGGRLLFSTDSDTIGIDVKYDYLTVERNLAPSATGFVLIELVGNTRKYIKILPPSVHDTNGYKMAVSVGDHGMRDYMLYFPMATRVRELQVHLASGARVEKLCKYDTDPIVYYGSSITQGFCAARPDSTYEAFIEKWNGIDFVNLGFSGSGKGEREMAEYLASLKCSLFVCDYNHSGVEYDYFEKTHKRLYRIFREKQPTTPILFLTKTNIFEGAESEEERIDRKTRADMVKATYDLAVSEGDKNVYFLHASEMFAEFSPTDRMSFATDSDHPNELGFYIMAKRIYNKMIEIDERFR